MGKNKQRNKDASSTSSTATPSYAQVAQQPVTSSQIADSAVVAAPALTLAKDGHVVDASNFVSQANESVMHEKGTITAEEAQQVLLNELKQKDEQAGATFLKKANSYAEIAKSQNDLGSASIVKARPSASFHADTGSVDFSNVRFTNSVAEHLRDPHAVADALIEAEYAKRRADLSLSQSADTHSKSKTSSIEVQDGTVIVDGSFAVEVPRLGEHAQSLSNPTPEKTPTLLPEHTLSEAIELLQQREEEVLQEQQQQQQHQKEKIRAQSPVAKRAIAALPEQIREKAEDVVEELTTKFNESPSDVVEEAKNKIKEKTGNVVDEVQNKIKEKTGNVVDEVQNKIKEKTGNVVEEVQNKIKEKTGNVVEEAKNKIKPNTGDLAKDVTSKIKESTETIKSTINKNVGDVSASDLASKAQETVSAVASDLKTAAKAHLPDLDVSEAAQNVSQLPQKAVKVAQAAKEKVTEKLNLDVSHDTLEKVADDVKQNMASQVNNNGSKLYGMAQSAWSSIVAHSPVSPVELVDRAADVAFAAHSKIEYAATLANSTTDKIFGFSKDKVTLIKSTALHALENGKQYTADGRQVGAQLLHDIASLSTGVISTAAGDVRHIVTHDIPRAPHELSARLAQVF